MPLTAECNHKSRDREILSFFQKYFSQNNWLENKNMAGFYSSGGTWLLNRIWQGERKPRREQVMSAVTLLISSPSPNSSRHRTVVPYPLIPTDILTVSFTARRGNIFATCLCSGFASLTVRDSNLTINQYRSGDNLPKAYPIPPKSLSPLPKAITFSKLKDLCCAARRRVSQGDCKQA